MWSKPGGHLHSLRSPPHHLGLHKPSLRSLWAPPVSHRDKTKGLTSTHTPSTWGSSPQKPKGSHSPGHPRRYTTAHRARQGLATRPGVPGAPFLTNTFLCSSTYFLDVKTGKRAVFEVDVKATKCCVEGKSQATCSWWGTAHFRGHAASVARGWEHKRKAGIVAARDPGQRLLPTVSPHLRMGQGGPRVLGGQVLERRGP